MPPTHLPSTRAPRRPTEVSVATIRASDAVVVPAGRDAVWGVLVDLADYRRWWPWLVQVEAVAIEPALVGSDIVVRPLAGPSFHCRVTEAVAGERLRVRYHGGPYAGTGEWWLEPAEAPGSTRVVYTVDLTTAHPLLQPLGRVVSLSALHSLLMGAVLQGLAREVGRRGG
jgi:ribosome-associated toxin RatA of RatAB toxin-antitoxin module